jgi:iron complex outermembrane receptor protein
VLALGLATSASAQPPRPGDLTELSPAELADIEVSISKKAERRSDLPAAVSVLTSEELRRTGVTTSAEALRLVPGVQVARANSNQWAIGIRGFASTLSRSLLVLIDGRSVYTPLYAGVYWDVQDTLFEDVDRVEVVRGPGGALWGANAVNGVVNLITKSAEQTPGLYIEGGAGSEERAFGAVRYGHRVGESTSVRAYAKYFGRDAVHHEDGSDFDDWHMTRGGFRLDSARGTRDTATLQGDVYVGRVGLRQTLTTYSPPLSRRIEQAARVSGGNMLGRWRRDLASGSSLSAQVYYDRTNRTDATLHESRDTVDVDLEHRVATLPGHDLVFGAGYRVTTDETGLVPTLVFDPPQRTDHLFSAFVSDEIRLAGDDLRFTLGAKVEHNDYSGFEIQPSGRLLWAPHPNHTVWLGVSRAVRTPSRVDTDLLLTVLLDPSLPLFARVIADKGFESETALVFEAGYRARVGTGLTLEVAGFYDERDDLLGLSSEAPFVESEPPPPPRGVVPYVVGNFYKAETYGGEVSLDVQPSRAWRVHAGYGFLRIVHGRKPGTEELNLTDDRTAGSSPRHQVFLRSSHDLPANTRLDVSFRHVTALQSRDVEGYSSLDARLAWQVHRTVNLAVVGQNLLEARHAEFGQASIQRGVYAKVSLRW